jgi:uncharacterized protein YjiS (DUF1127 family)
MTMINVDRVANRNSGISAQKGLMGKMKNFISRSRAERQLHQLDDRLLSDIGIVRGEISNQVWGN